MNVSINQQQLWDSLMAEDLAAGCNVLLQVMLDRAGSVAG